MSMTADSTGAGGVSAEYRSTRTLALWLIVALGTCGVSYAVTSVVDAYGRFTIPTWDDLDAEVVNSGEIVLLMLAAIGGVLLLGSMVVAIILFCVWVYRANRNARALGARGMRFTPGWTVGWFFVPIMNLFMPYQAVKEIWQTGDPRRGPDDWKTGGSTLVGAWWGFWLLANLGGRALDSIGATSSGQVAILFGVAAIDALLFVTASVLACCVVQGIVRRQERKVRGRGDPTDQSTAVDGE
jgi:hypothetical protein